jgi:predicted dithiol-disulfide oxidoreductase (DUF899 family)
MRIVALLASGTERVTKKYLFETPGGKETLEQLFEGRTQLVIYHAMFHPHKATARTPWTQDAACAMCSFWMDNFNGITTHLNHRDVTIIAASRAPVDKIAAYRMGEGDGNGARWVRRRDEYGDQPAVVDAR